MKGALIRYRVMALVVGIGLFLLVFVGIPLQAAGHPGLEQTVGFFHGILYIVYLVTVLDLFRRARLPWWYLVAMVAGGFVPFLAFFIERRISPAIAARGAREGWYAQGP